MRITVGPAQLHHCAHRLPETHHKISDSCTNNFKQNTMHRIYEYQTMHNYVAFRRFERKNQTIPRTRWKMGNWALPVAVWNQLPYDCFGKFNGPLYVADYSWPKGM